MPSALHRRHLLATYMAWLSGVSGAADMPSRMDAARDAVDFQSPGDIEVSSRGQRALALRCMRARGVLEGYEMGRRFRLLRSNNLIWHYVVHGWLYGERPAA